MRSRFGRTAVFAAALAALALGACATLNTAGMSETCRRLYDACLDGCPRAVAPPDGSLASTDWRLDTASCTNSCNEQAPRCQ
jgi:hypothetical protein